MARDAKGDLVADMQRIVDVTRAARPSEPHVTLDSIRTSLTATATPQLRPPFGDRATGPAQAVRR